MKSKLGDQVRLLHIKEAIMEVLSYVNGISFEVFKVNSMIYNASIRQLEVIGEASNRLSEELKNQYPNIPWRQIVGLRNMLIHEYFGVDVNIVWDVIKNELPTLLTSVNEMIGVLEEE
jgi:uncharacterized protein with HEPN domain